MIEGLHIELTSEELRGRLGERIRTLDAAIAYYDERLYARRNDETYDVGVADGLRSVDDLRRERQHFFDRVTQLTLIRDGLIAGETYRLGRQDLRTVELIAPDHFERELAPWEFVRTQLGAVRVRVAEPDGPDATQALVGNT